MVSDYVIGGSWRESHTSLDILSNHMQQWAHTVFSLTKGINNRSEMELIR